MASSRTQLEVIGFAQRRVPTTLWRCGKPTKHLAVLFPGWAYTCEAPVLYYARLQMLELGADVVAIDYGYSELEGFRDLPSDDQDRVFAAEVDAALKAANRQDYDSFTLIGKSIGTQAVCRLLSDGARTRGSRGVFLTPSFAYQPFCRSLEKVTQPCMFAIGSKDPQFSESAIEAARRLGPVTVIPDADHSLDVAGDVVMSIQAVREVVERMRAFLGDLGFV